MQREVEDRSPDRVKTKTGGRLQAARHSATGRPQTLYTAKGPGWCVKRRAGGTRLMRKRNHGTRRRRGKRGA